MTVPRYNPSDSILALVDNQSSPSVGAMAALMHEAPLSFLAVAAKVVSAWGDHVPQLISQLIEQPIPEQHSPEQHSPEQHSPEQHSPEQHSPEQHSLAVALCWLGSPRPGQPLIDPDLIDIGSGQGLVPPWLLHLDQTEIIGAYRRRLPAPFDSVSAYLIDLRFIDERIGTLHLELDHQFDGALVHVCGPPLPSYDVRRLTAALDRRRADRDRARPYRPIKPATAKRALAAAFAARESVSPPLELDDQWPLLWPLLSFVAYGLDDG